MATRRSFLTLFGLLPFVKPAKAVTRESLHTQDYRRLYERHWFEETSAENLSLDLHQEFPLTMLKKT